MNKIQLQILGISSGHTSTSYTLILEEKGGSRKLPIIIGAFEAQAIAIEIEKIKPARPMTHDLFRAFANAFDVKVIEVLIHKLEEGVFYSNIICHGDGRTEEIDARTSDAIALALRFNCPIYTYEEIIEEAGIILGELETEKKATSGTQPQSTKRTSDLTGYSNAELQLMLDDAIEMENYIEAAKIRDEMAKREGKQPS